MAWSYRFKSDIVISFNESNEQKFIETYEELKLDSEWGFYGDITDLKQKKISVVEINRDNYNIDPRVFVDLPFIPYDWGKVKFAFDSGLYTVLSRASEDYYLQPEFYDDWNEMGLQFYTGPKKACKSGFFSTPTGQKIYTKQGASIDTFMLLRASFCVGNPQSLKLQTFYPKSGVTNDGIKYEQDPDFVKRYITLSYEPSNVILGKTFPRFDIDWAKKIKIRVSVNRHAPKGIYVVAIGAVGYEQFLGSRKYVNHEAYLSKGGMPLMYIMIAVD
jgi:hypothetical protein